MIFSPFCSQVQGHHPLTVFCSNRDTSLSADWSRSCRLHFSGDLAGRSMWFRSITRCPKEAFTVHSHRAEQEGRNTSWQPGGQSHDINTHIFCIKRICLVESNTCLQKDGSGRSVAAYKLDSKMQICIHASRKMSLISARNLSSASMHMYILWGKISFSNCFVVSVYAAKWV